MYTLNCTGRLPLNNNTLQSTHICLGHCNNEQLYAFLPSTLLFFDEFSLEIDFSVNLWTTKFVILFAIRGGTIHALKWI